MANEIGYEEKTYFLIGAVGKYGTLYSPDNYDAKLTLDLKLQYTLTIPQGKQVDFIAVTNQMYAILANRGQRVSEMHLNTDGSYKIKTTTIPKSRAIQDIPQA